ncbi:hypothetical protein C0Q70_21375 [Pomacea canaliculata]|uniref:Uncharacterized protein n=1 Tax=Pomacea canaliculata TaxID=400727 RepID=A0A2T7NCF6_POMCA|nr:hypothetical protein C0Q70_21375 [Pomacea canaliculata]
MCSRVAAGGVGNLFSHRGRQPAVARRAHVPSPVGCQKEGEREGQGGRERSCQVSIFAHRKKHASPPLIPASLLAGHLSLQNFAPDSRLMFCSRAFWVLHPPSVGLATRDSLSSPEVKGKMIGVLSAVIFK